jgi:hypothetical protein
MPRQSASVVKVRAATFIPEAWIARPREEDEPLVEFRGDDREFTPHAANTGRSRVEQEAVVDFARESIRTWAETGRSKERVTYPDGREEVSTGKAPTEGVFCTDVAWRDDEVAFDLHASASNPLVAHADPVDYHLELTVGRDGRVEVAGRHDGYPCFECYAQTDFGEFRTLYRYDYRERGAGPDALAGPMDCEFERQG